jgi:hypothetical protein
MFMFLGIAWAQLFGYLYSSYLVLWLNSHVATGYIESAKEVEAVYSRMTLIAFPGGVLMIIGAFFIVDFVEPVLLIAPGFFGRSITTYLFKHLKDPKGVPAHILTSLLVITSIL